MRFLTAAIAKGKIAINRRGLVGLPEKILLLEIYGNPERIWFCKSGRTEKRIFSFRNLIATMPFMVI